MDEIPFVAFGNDELVKNPRLKKGDTVKCRTCPERHVVSCAKDENGKETDLLLFYKCGEKTYLAGVDGRSVMERFR